MILQALQIFSLILGIVGTVLVFFNSPFHSRSYYMHTFGESAEIEKEDKRIRNMAKIGFGIICISYIIQTVISIIQINIL